MRRLPYVAISMLVVKPPDARVVLTALVSKSGASGFSAILPHGSDAPGLEQASEPQTPLLWLAQDNPCNLELFHLHLHQIHWRYRLSREG